nr:MAG TPA: Pectate lyase [Caudoviricetes sp.]
MSYETLMSCSLYELEYWQARAEELIQEAEMRYEESKE